MKEGKIRVLLTRSLLEGHDMGIRMVANKCRDHGFEVIYTRFGDIEEIVKSAEQEDVDIVGVTSSSGNHLYIASELMKLLKASKVEIPVIFGGVVPSIHVPRLQEIGVRKVFGPGSSPGEAVQSIWDLAGKSAE